MRKKKALRKFIFQEIRTSKARFISITLLILIGVSFFSALNASGPDMLKTAALFFDKQNLMDIHVVSTMGFEKDDIEILKNQADVEQLEGGYSKDVITEIENKLLKVYSYKNTNQLNKFDIKVGRLPEKTGEIALLGSNEIKSIYQIGDTVTFIPESDDSELSDHLKRTSYTVVGFVTSPLYVSEKQLGSTSIGKGSLDGYGVIMAEDFNLSIYTDVYMTFHSLKGVDPYNEAYKSKIKEYQDKIEDSFKERAVTRLQDIKIDATKELADAKIKVADGKQELIDGLKKLNDANIKIQDGEKQIAKAESKLANAQKELVKGQAEYDANKTSFNNKMADAKSQLEAANTKLKKEQQTVNENIEKVKQGEQKVTQALTQLVEQEKTLTEQKTQLTALLEETRNVIAVPVSYITDEQKSALIQSGSSISVGDSQTLSDLWTSYFKGEASGSSLVEALEGVITQLESGLKTASDTKQQLSTQLEELNNNQIQLDNAQKSLTSGSMELHEKWQTYEAGKANGYRQLAVAKNKLKEGWSDYNEGIKTLETEKHKLKDAKQKYENGLNEYNDKKVEAEKELADAEEEIADGEKSLEDLEKPVYYAFSREDNPGYTEYADNAKRLSALSLVFPLFFFAIAALVSLTTITRMIEEQRVQIGTLKAQGYTNWEISLKYYVYALGASILGTTLGLLLGFYGIPQIIINAYRSMYDFPNRVLDPYLIPGLFSFVIAVFCTGVTAWAVLRQDLKSSPAELMRPKAPKLGKRILLERIPLIWNRLNFIEKVTMRNLFRYKQRMLMTVFGIAGCMGLMMTGFGLNDSISDISALQFNDLLRYQALVVFDEDAKKEEIQKAEEAISNTSGLEEYLLVHEEQFEVKKSGVNTQQALVLVPKDTDKFSQFVSLRSRIGKQSYVISEDGAVITEKLANLYGIIEGDTITITDSDNQQFKIPVAKITENYTGHYIYMTPRTYQKYVHRTSMSYNAALLSYHQDKAWEDTLSNTLNQYRGILAVSFHSSMIVMFDDSMGSLNTVVVVLIICAAVLAFVVLYNLTNINVSERIRELSTIKVLGFYDKEVTMYIYRENVILSLIGILFGSFVGKFLHYFVLNTAAMDNMMFSYRLHVHSYVFAGLLTLLFSSMVMWVMHNKLKHVDMIEALKSND